MSGEAEDGRRSTAFLRVSAVGVVLLLGGVAFLPPDRAAALIRHGGWWLGLLLCAGLMGSLVRNFRGLRIPRRISSETAAGIAVLLAGGYLLFLHEDFGFRTAFSEYTLSGVAQNLHYGREVVVPVFGRLVDREFFVFGADAFQGSWGFPFLLSLVHDFTGYRPENAFLLNAVLGVAVLGLSWLLGRRLAGIAGGAAAVGLWVTVPALAQCATGGGEAVLQLCLLLLVARHSLEYWRKPDAGGLAALVFATVALTFVGAAALALLPPLAVLVLLAGRRGGPVLPGPAALAGLALLAGPLLRIVANRPGHGFGLENLPGHLEHAVYFLFNAGHGLGNSLLLAVLGLPALLVFFVELRRRWSPSQRDGDPEIPLFLVGSGMLLVFLVSLCGAEALPDEPAAAGLVLPLYLVLILVLVRVTGFFARDARPWWILAGLIGLYLVGWTMPVKAKAIPSLRNTDMNEMRWLQETVAPGLEEKALFIDRETIPYSVCRRGSFPASRVADDPWLIAGGLRSGKYPAVYFVDRIEFSVVDGEPVAGPPHEALRFFEYEPVARRSFEPFRQTRVLRLTGPREEALPPEREGRDAERSRARRGELNLQL